jgi:hypothetical protein
VLNFKELPSNGQAFEQLVRELLFSYGMRVAWSGVGSDGGRDLICEEVVPSIIMPHRNRWLVQCKHNAHGGKSVSLSDLDDIVTSCTQHQATGYLLACSTKPSSGVVQRLESITANPTSRITATYWDAVTIERLLSAPNRWGIAQRFMPVSSGAWKIYATERPNDFVAHYEGHVFHLTNRIGSKVEHHLPALERRFAVTQGISLPKGQFIRTRAVHYDDKNGGYHWYIDYMIPGDQAPALPEASLLHLLHDGYVLEDGAVHGFDISYVSYSEVSDHYDRDHYDYYVDYLPNFLQGAPRAKQAWRRRFALQSQVEALEQEALETRDTAFNEMTAAFNALPFLRTIGAVNVQVEHVHKFARRFDWQDIASELSNMQLNCLFEAQLRFVVEDEARFLDLLNHLPLDFDRNFTASHRYVFLPGSGFDAEEDKFYDLRLSLVPSLPSNEWDIRKKFNEYFTQIKAAVAAYAIASQPTARE